MAGILDLLNPATIASAIPADFTQKVIEGLAVSTAGTVLLAGAKSQEGANALDPLHLIHKDSPNNNPNNIVGATITASAFAALPAVTQAQLAASGVHIVAG